MLPLEKRIDRRQACIGVIGLGYVGLPLLRAFFDAGFAVLGFDVDPAKIRQLKQGRNYLKHLGRDLVSVMAKQARFNATDDFAQLDRADALIVCVPTPLGRHLEPDMSYIEKTTQAIAKTLRKGQLVVLESTTYPRTTREVMLPVLEQTGLRCGKDFYLAFSPEREDPGRKDFRTTTIPKLVGGIDAVSGRIAARLYACAIKQVIPVASAEVAEAAKLLENIYRSVNIALVNEMKVVLSAMGIDIWQVIQAASTKPFGFQAFYPGPGLGGHCIPIDPYYLTWKAREYGMTTRFIELAGEVNHRMPEYVVQRTVLALNDAGVAAHGARVLILGLAYKPNVDDIRESPSFELIEQFRRLGAKVDYSDPHVPQTHKMRKHDLGMKSVALSARSLPKYDVVVVATHHDAFDWPLIARHARLIVDTRNALAGQKIAGGKLVKA